MVAENKIDKNIPKGLYVDHITEHRKKRKTFFNLFCPPKVKVQPVFSKLTRKKKPATRKFVVYLHNSNEFNQNICKNDSRHFFFERMDTYSRQQNYSSPCGSTCDFSLV